MPTCIALLRGINVGGSGLLPMQQLVELCASLGLPSARTYIQSGNLVLSTAHSAPAIRALLEPALAAGLGKPVDVMVRTAAEMHAILTHNPFPDQHPATVAVVFLHHPPPPELTHRIATPGGERILPGARELYIDYPEGMGRSRLKLPPQLAPATIRNINTVARLVAMATG